MNIDAGRTCCFSGHRPDKLPWGFDEQDPRCTAIKRSLSRELERLYHRGFRHFISGMAMGCDLYFAEAALELREWLHQLRQRLEASLSPLERRVLALYLSGCPRRELPEKLGVSQKSCDNALHRVRSKLRAME